MRNALLGLYATFSLSFFLFLSPAASAQNHSIARDWNETLLFSISEDFARPTVHARNLFHSSILMHDAWAAYEPQAQTYFLGKTIGDFSCEFSGVPAPENYAEAQKEAISFAMYRLIEHRYGESPGIVPIFNAIDSLMAAHGYDQTNTSTDYTIGGPAELGNYLAEQLIAFGYQDGSNEANDYANVYYEPINPPIEVEEPGNPEMNDPNRWQQIQLTVAIDQSGEIVDSAPDFLSPEWGNVVPFAMTDENLTVKTRDGHDYQIYYDPGEPAYLDTTTALGLESDYKWNFMMVPIWQSHHDTDDGVMWDISPASQGNIQSYPSSQAELENFYDYFDGGDPGEGYDVNPITGESYEPQMVPRADYARVLAEFWADGPESVTPPGHWFDIYNDISDHPLFERNWMGEGDALDTLEYDVKAYFALGGAMHDVAISAWGIKGYYDYPRPVSAVRYMADKGQCTNNSLDNYHPAGVPLVPGYVEVVEAGDELAGDADENVGKIKLYTWRGPEYVEDPDTDEAGVGWILAENWWPYQRPSFVSPPFAGYISGHSTYSRAAAEVLTLMTGSAFFPGGMSEYSFEANDFLVFEQGPSQTIDLQWATYRDASDQCSLSRIWGGIHPAVDDIPGRLIGMEIGPQAFNLANDVVTSSAPFVADFSSSVQVMNENATGESISVLFTFDQTMNTEITPSITFFGEDPSVDALNLENANWVNDNTFAVSYELAAGEYEYFDINMGISGAESDAGQSANPFISSEPFKIDTKKPTVLSAISNISLVNDEATESNQLVIELVFSEPCDTLNAPAIAFDSAEELGNSLTWLEESSQWLSPNSYQAIYELTDENITAPAVGVEISAVFDIAQNELDLQLESDVFSMDTKNPMSSSLNANSSAFNLNDAGNSAIVLTIDFDEAMNTEIDPQLLFPNHDILENSVNYNPFSSSWVS
ncbi:MAG: vanadium-dependent haloperoxidase, partial [Cryomorphaceae bacterium]